jgi:hypothetical protein
MVKEECFMDWDYETEITYIPSGWGDDYFTYEVRHEGLHECRRVRSKNDDEAQMKAQTLAEKWDARWEKRCEIEAKKQEKEKKKQEKEDRLQEAIDLTNRALSKISEIENILAETVSISNVPIWSTLKNNDKFSVAKPKKPKLTDIPPEPQKDWDDYKVKLGFLDKLSTTRKNAKEKEAAERYFTDHDQWKKDSNAINKKTRSLQLSMKRIFKTGKMKKLHFTKSK